MKRFFFPVVVGTPFVGALLATAAEFKFPGQTLTVPNGFTVERVAEPPLALRPMMAEFDDRGRLYVADSSGSNDKVDKQLQDKPHRIVRLEDTDGDGRFDRSAVFADKLMFPEGVLWFDEAVYTGAPPSIWRLVDTDGDGAADQRAEWHEGKTLTGCANDLHGPYLGPDGWIYWCKGAFAKQTYERPGLRTISDNAAHVFRARPDHSTLDAVMGGGMDNPVEVAFSPEGELFFITTFFHHPEAGKRDALVHCVYGGAYPKIHGAIDGLQRTGELLPPLVELGPAAACALTWYQHDAFGPEFQANLFSTEFNLRKVMRHVLTPKGSTYTARSEDFLVSDNPDFHPTDVFEDADGSLLVIDTGGWYKICCPTSQLPKPDVLGAIYRIRRAGLPKADDPRGLRLAWEDVSPAALAGRLGDSRPAVRRRVLAALAKRGGPAVGALRTVLKREPSALARLNAVWALTRIDGEESLAAVREALSDSDASVQQAALHSVGLRRDRAALPALLLLLQSENRFHQRKAAEALGRIGERAAVAPLLAVAGSFRTGFPEDAAAERIHEHAIVFALIEIADPVGTRQGLASGNPFTQRAALIALDQMDGGGHPAPAIASLLGSPNPILKSTAAWIAGHHPEWGGDLAGYFRGRLQAGDLSEAERTELQHQLGLFERNEAIQQLVADKLGDPTLPRASRLLLLRSMTESGLKSVPAPWLAMLAARVEDRDTETARAAIATLRALPLGKTNAVEIADALGRVAADPARPEELRVEALAALPGGLARVDEPTLALLLRRVDPTLPAAQRGAAAAVLARARLAEDQLAKLAGRLIAVGPMELNRLLEAFNGATNEALGLKLVAGLRAAPALSSIRVDLLRQRLDAFPSSVREAGHELLVALNVDPAEQNRRIETLLTDLHATPGDIRRGQAIFNSQKTACSTCHAMGYLGGRVGPDLTSIGQIRTERDLLEAIVYPSASFVRSYEPVAVTTADGEDYSGVLLNETADELTLATGADAVVRVARRDVTEMRPGTVSVMPAGLDEQLSKQDLSDLVAFLKNTRWGAQ